MAIARSCAIAPRLTRYCHASDSLTTSNQSRRRAAVLARSISQAACWCARCRTQLRAIAVRCRGCELARAPSPRRAASHIIDVAFALPACAAACAFQGRAVPAALSNRNCEREGRPRPCAMRAPRAQRHVRQRLALAVGINAEAPPVSLLSQPLLTAAPVAPWQAGGALETGSSGRCSSRDGRRERT